MEGLANQVDLACHDLAIPSHASLALPVTGVPAVGFRFYFPPFRGEINLTNPTSMVQNFSMGTHTENNHTETGSKCLQGNLF